MLLWLQNLGGAGISERPSRTIVIIERRDRRILADERLRRAPITARDRRIFVEQRPRRTEITARDRRIKVDDK
jgi:hypothetical protein